MKLNLSLLKLIPLLVTLTAGVLLPTNMAKAASAAPTKEVTIKQETVKDGEQTEEHHGDGEHHGGGEHHATGGIPQILFSKKAQKIEFVTFLSLIGCSILLPELLHKPKQKNKNNNLVNFII